MYVICEMLIVFVAMSEISSLPHWTPELSPPQMSIVEVKLISRTKRSLYSGYDLELKAFDKTHRLQLRSATSSIFTDQFQYHDVDIDENGNIINTARTPSKREIREIEENIFVDEGANAVLKVREVDGQLDMEGVIDTVRIGRDAKNSSRIIATEDHPEPSGNQTDYVDLKRPVATPRGISTGTVSVTPEIAIMFDYGNGKTFNFDETKIMDYLAVMINAVNNRFATLDDPKVKFRLSAIYTIKSIGGQPFLEGSKVSGGKIDINKLLSSFKDWVFGNMNDFRKHDIVSLAYSYESSTSSIGLAHLGGACLIDAPRKCTYATNVNRDEGGSWRGAMVLAHELAHSIGAPHDGIDEKAKECPWNDGYIQSYVGIGKMNKFTFSKCSAQLMKAFIQSTGGSCLWKQDNGNPIKEIPGSIGDRITMVDLCKKRTGSPNALVYSDNPPDEQCMRFMCEVTVGYNTDITGYENTGDNLPCGYSGGRCKEGKCVG